MMMPVVPMLFAVVFAGLVDAPLFAELQRRREDAIGTDGTELYSRRKGQVTTASSACVLSLALASYSQ